MPYYYCSRCHRDDCTGSHRCFIYGFKLTTPRLADKVSPLIKKIVSVLNDAGVELDAPLKDIAFHSQRLGWNDRAHGAWNWFLVNRLKNKDLKYKLDGYTSEFGVIGSRRVATKLVKGDIFVGPPEHDEDIELYPAK